MAMCIGFLLVCTAVVISVRAIVRGARWIARETRMDKATSWLRCKLVALIEWCSERSQMAGARIISLAERELTSGKSRTPRMVVADLMDGSYPEARDYDLNYVVSDGFYTSEEVRNGRLTDVLGEIASESTESLMLALVEVPGVASVIFWKDNRYRAHIRKGSAFEWDEVEPEIVKAFRSHFGWGTAPIEVVRTTKYEHLRTEREFSTPTYI